MPARGGDGTVPGVARRSTPVLVLVLWTLFVWSTRISTAASGGDTGAALVATGFSVAALVTGAAWLRRASWQRTAVVVLSALTGAVWLVRTPMIWVNDHPVGFKVVHTVLAVASIALALWAERSERDVERQRQAAAPTAGLEELADR